MGKDYLNSKAGGEVEKPRREEKSGKVSKYEYIRNEGERFLFK